MANYPIARLFTGTVRIILFLTRPLSEYILAFIYRLLMGKKKALPPIQNKILLLSAKELARKIRKRQLKCEDAMKVYIVRCQAVHPFINAIVGERYDGALRDAKSVDRFLATTQKSEKEIEKDTPLLGVPFSCKEAIGVKGMPQTCGILKEKGRISGKDSDVAALYKKAGAIPVTVSNVPEYCMWIDSTNLVFGMAKNPYDHTRSVGGSSGGEGAIIASACAVIGIGNDIAGSIRIPSNFCGIYGHKPSRGLTSNVGMYPGDVLEKEKIDALVSTGPMCRYAEDLPLLLEILAKEEKKLLLKDKVNFRRVKVYYMEQFPDYFLKPVPAIRKAIKKAANYFEENFGMKAVELHIQDLDDTFNVWECKLQEAEMPLFKTFLAGENGHINLWWELFKSIFGLSSHTLPAIYFGLMNQRKTDECYEQCLKKYERLENKFQDIFQEDAILLLPAFTDPPPHYLMSLAKFVNIGYTAIFNTLGFPGTIVPAGFYMGTPITVQIVSGRNKDRLTIAAAIELDRLFGGWKSPSAPPTYRQLFHN